jgi:putative colanic acid biosynthesis acetyltransferase WcaF
LLLNEKPKQSCFQTLDQAEPSPYPAWEYRRRFAWQCVQPAVMSLPWPGAFRRRRRVLNWFGADLAQPSAVQRGVGVMHPWLLTMGPYSMLGPHVTVYNLGQVSIGAHTLISQHVYLCAGSHDYGDPRLPLLRPAITVGEGVWIAAGAFIGPGVTIGNNAVVGARAVVMSDVEAGKVVVGNPARVVKDRPMHG